MMVEWPIWVTSERFDVIGRLQFRLLGAIAKTLDDEFTEDRS